MSRKREIFILAIMCVVFAVCYFLPVGQGWFDDALTESLRMVRDYARQHVLFCLIPAFFIAGAIAGFISKSSVMKYLGVKANKFVSYGVASVSGAILAVCSCTVLPLFAGIYRMGAGVGPAVTFLYAGPAINVLAIIMTANVLGIRLGIARAAGAVIFSIVIGIAMHLIFRGKGSDEAIKPADIPQETSPRPAWKGVLFFIVLIAVLVFANWSRSGSVRAVFTCCPGGKTIMSIQGDSPREVSDGWMMKNRAGEEFPIYFAQSPKFEKVEANPVSKWIYRSRWGIVAALCVMLAGMLWFWFRRDELSEWMHQTWDFAKMILPLLLAGVLVSGFLLGSPGREGIIPNSWVEQAVGGNSLRANFFASIAGSLMYFATLTEIPIVEGLLRSGMGRGPALALLLAGPAVSLPSVLVVRSVLGTKKTLVYCILVITAATSSGMIYGIFFDM